MPVASCSCARVRSDSSVICGAAAGLAPPPMEGICSQAASAMATVTNVMPCAMRCDLMGIYLLELVPDRHLVARLEVEVLRVRREGRVAHLDLVLARLELDGFHRRRHAARPAIHVDLAPRLDREHERRGRQRGLRCFTPRFSPGLLGELVACGFLAFLLH